LYINLTPLIPLSFKGEGEGNRKEGLSPLLNTLTTAYFKQEGEKLHREG